VGLRGFESQGAVIPEATFHVRALPLLNSVTSVSPWSFRLAPTLAPGSIGRSGSGPAEWAEALPEGRTRAALRVLEHGWPGAC